MLFLEKDVPSFFSLLLNDAEKEIQIFDVLGKKVFQSQLNTRELNISSLSPGVYIIKIREEESTATRKLIIR